MTHQYQMSTTTNANYFTIFLQIIDIVNFYWFSFEPIINITFLLKGSLIQLGSKEKTEIEAFICLNITFHKIKYYLNSIIFFLDAKLLLTSHRLEHCM